MPPGINTGQKLRIPNKAHPGTHGGLSGDLYINIRIMPHNVFTREGDDLFIQKTITFSQAVLGASVDVPTLDGENKRVKVPPGTQAHTKIRMKGFGFPRFKGAGRGDAYLRFVIEIPQKLSKKQLQLIKDLSEEGL